jgi:hypothetical protein
VAIDLNDVVVFFARTGAVDLNSDVFRPTSSEGREAPPRRRSRRPVLCHWQPFSRSIDLAIPISTRLPRSVSKLVRVKSIFLPSSMSRSSVALAVALLCAALAASAAAQQCGIYPIQPWVQTINQVQFSRVDWPSFCQLYGTVYCPSNAFTLNTKSYNAQPVLNGGKGGLAVLTYDNQPYLRPAQVANTTVTWDPCAGYIPCSSFLQWACLCGYVIVYLLDFACAIGALIYSCRCRRTSSMRSCIL